MNQKKCPTCNTLFRKPSYCGEKRWEKRIYCSNKCRAQNPQSKIKNTFSHKKITKSGQLLGVSGNDLTGKKFNHLTVLSIHSRNRNNQIKWMCRCDCGREIAVLGLHLTKEKGSQKSCGCMILRGKNRKDWTGYEEISGQFWHGIQRGANGSKGRKKILFDITIQEAWDIYIKQNKKCALSGIKICFPEKWDTAGTASLDRIDSSLGYVKDNIQWVHKDINKMKNSFDQNYFIKLCQLISEHNAQTAGMI